MTKRTENSVSRLLALLKGKAILELHVPSQAKRLLRCGNCVTKHNVKLSKEKNENHFNSSAASDTTNRKNNWKSQAHYCQAQEPKYSFLMPGLFIEASELK